MSYAYLIGWLSCLASFPPRGWCWECWDGSEDDTNFDKFGEVVWDASDSGDLYKGVLTHCAMWPWQRGMLAGDTLYSVLTAQFMECYWFCINFPGFLLRTQITSLVRTLLDHRKAIKVGSVGKVKMNKHLDISLNSIIILHSRSINPAAVYKCHVASTCAW